MSIFDLTKLFWRTTRASGPNPYDALLFFYLVQRCNIGGWKNPFIVYSRDVDCDLKLPRKTLAAVRSRLKQNGLIDYIPGNGKKEPPLYCFPEVCKDGSVIFPRDFLLQKQKKLGTPASRISLKPEVKNDKVTDRVTDKVTDRVTDRVTIIKDYKTKDIDEEDAREKKLGCRDGLKDQAGVTPDFESVPGRDKATVGEAAPARPGDSTEMRIRRAEAEVQCHHVRQDVLSRPSMIEALAVKHDTTPETVTEAMEEVLGDWSEGGILHTSGGHFDLSNALLHLRHLLPIKLGVIRRRRDHRQEYAQERKVTKYQNNGKQQDKYAAQRAVEPRAKKHADFKSAF